MCSQDRKKNRVHIGRIHSMDHLRIYAALIQGRDLRKVRNDASDLYAAVLAGLGIDEVEAAYLISLADTHDNAARKGRSHWAIMGDFRKDGVGDRLHHFTLTSLGG